MNISIIKVKMLREVNHLPERKTSGAAGFDLLSAIDAVIEPGAFQGIPTGISLEIPNSIEAQVRPRSGLALNYGIGILNSPGTIDSDYRGEVVVILFNLNKKPFVIKKNDRIAQIVFSKLAKVELRKAKKLSPTKRGKGGFGHTGR
jgi:dUTP pyrophosphatase